MGLFLPLLVLGLAQAADPQPAPAPPLPAVQHAWPATPRTFTLTPDAEPRKFSLPAQATSTEPRQLSPVDPAEPDVVTGLGPPVCLTMRSYYFERRDGLAPEYVGMSTCESSRAIGQKRAHRRPARIVPAY